MKDKIPTITACCSGSPPSSLEEKKPNLIMKTCFLDYELTEKDTEPNKIVIDKGCVEEGPDWSIVFDEDVTSYYETCVHERQKDTYLCNHVKKIDGRFILPRGVVAENEGGCCRTLICLDCILAVARCPIVKERKY